MYQQQQKQVYKQIGEYIIEESTKLGEGCFGQVFKGFQQSDLSTPLAIKQINIKKYIQSQNQKNYVQMLVQELKILQNLQSIQSDFIMNAVDFFRTPNNIYQIFQYANGGNLKQKIQSYPNHILPENIAMKYFVQVLEGYKVLLSKNIIHRDIKPDNILLHQDNAILSDFGLGKILDKNGEISQDIEVYGTPYYQPPQLLLEDTENIKQVKATNKIDIWAMGIVLYQMLHGKRPWFGENIIDLKKNIENVQLEINPDINKDIQDLIIKMLQIEENNRISWQDIYQHPAVVKYQNLIQIQDQQLQEYQNNMYQMVLEH